LNERQWDSHEYKIDQAKDFEVSESLIIQVDRFFEVHEIGFCPEYLQPIIAKHEYVTQELVEIRFQSE
jgi:hypothetical protein